MTLRLSQERSPLNFRQRATLGLAFLSLLLLTPFAVNNFIQGRTLLGAGSLAIVAIIVLLAFDVRRIEENRDSIWAILLCVAIVVFLVLSLQRQGRIGAYWCYPAIPSFYILLTERRAWIANGLLVVIAVPQAWSVIPSNEVLRIAATMVAASGFSVIFIRALTRQQRELHEMAVTDSLTGLLNRKTLGPSLEEAIRQQERDGASMTLLALDLDHFKEINDSLGHDAGDSALQSVGAALRERLRSVDKVFRVGGEEFLVLLWATDAEGGRHIAEEFRRKLESNPLSLESSEPLTVSIGVATLETGESWEQWMKRADDNLYQAKIEGRNQVVALGPGELSSPV